MFNVGPNVSVVLAMFIGIVLFTTFVAYLITKNKLFAVLIFSSLSNYFLSLFYDWPVTYGGDFYPALFVYRIWPIINILLLIAVITMIIFKKKNNV